MAAPTIETTRTTPGDSAARPDDGDLEHASVFFSSQRARLLRIACRVTGGDAFSAEDVVQEAWLRWQRTDRAAVRNPEAFLTTATTRLAINVVQSAGHRHESPGDVLSAPLADNLADPAVRTDQTAAVADALALLLARLSGGELAAYLLRKVFDYPYDEIAHLLRTSVVNARQLVRRAAPRLEHGPARTAVDAPAHRHLLSAFLTAARDGEVGPLERLLAHRAAPAVAGTPVGPPAGLRATTPVMAA